MEGDEDNVDDNEEEANQKMPMFPNLQKPRANARAASTAAREDADSDDNTLLSQRTTRRRAATTPTAPPAKKTKTNAGKK